MVSNMYSTTAILNTFFLALQSLVLTIRTSHKRFELSFELLRRRVPFEFMATDVTSPKCDVTVLTHTPETKSQNLIVISFDPLTIRLPRGLTMTLETAS